MIRKLRNKLILVSMISLFTVRFLIISLSMAVSYRHLTMEADRTLAVLAGNGGVFPLESGPFKSAPELPFESRFFFCTSDKYRGADHRKYGTDRRSQAGQGIGLCQRDHRFRPDLRL